MNALFATPLIQEHYAEATETAAQDARELYDQLVGREFTTDDPSVADFESVLEVLFYIWFRAYTTVRLDFVRLRRQVSVEVEGQSYRLDFEVVCSDLSAFNAATLEGTPFKWQRIGVEVDGHAFHEKTREQATYRNRRDRDLQRAGWRIFHFSYDELTKKPRECVAEVIDYARMKWLALSTEAYFFKHPELRPVDDETRPPRGTPDVG